MAHGWDSYHPNLQPPLSIPRPCEVSSGPEGNLSQPIENFNAHHDLSNMEVSEEAVSTNSDFGSNLYPNSATNSDCAFSYYTDTPWQADQHQSVEDGSSKCENGDFSNLTADGLTTSSHFPSSFAADLREIKEDCEILAPSFLEDYSDVSSCSDTNINETEMRPSCKYMKSLDTNTAIRDNLITTKHSPSEWPFTPTGNMSISSDFPTSQMSETPLILPIPSELHDKARETADCAEENMETKEDTSNSCAPKHSTLASAKSLETENDQEENAGTEQKLKNDMEEKTVPIQAKELNVTIGSHKDMAEDTTNSSSEYERELKWQEKKPLVYKQLTSVLSFGKDLDVKIQETATELSDLIQDNKEVCDGKETIDQNHVSSPGLHENGMDDTSDTMLSSATECAGLIGANVSHPQDAIHELDDDNTGTLEEVKMANVLKITSRGVSQFQCPAQLSSEGCQDIICSNNVEDSKCDSIDTCYNQTLSGSKTLLEQPSESESTDQLHQPTLNSITDEEKPLQSIVTATEQHEGDGTESLKESFQETRASFEQPDLGMKNGEALPRANTPFADHETSDHETSEQKGPVTSLENSNLTDLKVQLPELKSSLQLQKRMQPIIILKTLEPVNGIKEYQCTECQHSTKNVDDIIEHHHSHSQHEFKFCPTSNIYLLHDDPQSKHACDVTGYALPEKVVLETMRKKKKIYKCKSCSHVSHRFYQHVQHTRTHTGRTPFKCNECNLYFSQSSCLYRHLRIAGRCRGSKHKSNARLNIPKSKTTKPEQATEKVVEFKGLPDCYVKLVDISGTHVCPFCCKIFASSKKKNKHVSNVHKVKGVIKGMAKSEVDELGKYKCTLCPRFFKYSYNRARHLRHCIKEQTNGANWKIGSKYQCPLCKDIFSLANNRTRHIQNNCLRNYLRKLAITNPKISLAIKDVPSTTTDPEDIRGYKCSLCPARFFHPSGKYKHMKKHELYKLTGKIVRYRSFPISINKKNPSSKKTVKSTDTSISNKTNHRYGFSCSFCGKRFSKSVSLTNHERIHKGDRPFLCLECGKGFARRNHLINHKTIHQRRIQCTVCKKILPSIGELIQHRKTHLKRGQLQCPYCPLLFDYPVYLLRHLASHKSESQNQLDCTEKKVKPPLSLQSLHKQKVSQCSLCKEDFEDPQSLRKHCLKHITESSFQCPFCQHHFNSRRCLVRHIERHSGDKPFPCNDCGKRFHRIINLDLHKKTCSASKLEENQLEVVEVFEKPAENVSKLLCCSYCPRTFSRTNRFKKHQNGHKLNTLLSCSKCNLFYGRTKLSQHEKNCHGPTAIDQIGKSLPNQVVEKKLHGTNITKTFPHICPHCPQKFQYRSFLLRHLISHTKKSFACDHCGRQYGNKSMCIKHEALCGGVVGKDDAKLHSYNQPRLLRPTSVKEAKEKNTDSEAEYKCKFCTKTFWKASNLRRHILTHTEVKPYRCKACDSCFSRYDHLKLHQTRCKGKRQRLEVCLPKISLDAVGKGWQKQGHSLVIAEEQRFECNICLKIFTCQSKLARHVSMLHNKSTLPINRRKNIALSTGIDRLYGITSQILEQYPIKRQRNACIYCPRTFKSGWQLGVHTRLHTGEKPFLCNLCGERFIRRDYLMRHSSKCNPTKGGHELVPCNQCKELLPKESLEIHQLDCSNASVSGDLQKSSEITSNGFSCAYCDSTFLIFSQLQQHFLNSHKQDTVKSPVPTTSLQQHLSNIVSIKEEPLDATNDEKQINGDGKILFSCNTKVDDAGERPFPCSFCNLRFKNRSGLGGHLRTHSNSAPFSCLRCMKSFWNKNHQRRHSKKCKRLEVLSKKNVGLKSLVAISSEIDTGQNDSVLVFKEGSKIHHRGTGVLQTEFSCKDYPEGLQEENQVQTSSVEKKAVHYQCSECDQSFTDGLMLITHLEDHGRVEQEKNRNMCPECGKVCNNGANLDRHMKAHGIDKTYPCLECSKRFPTLGKLLVHKKLHKKRSRPFLCKICSQRFWSNKSLLGHFSENHPNELHFCKLCSKHYTLKRSLIRHYKTRHRIRQLDQYIDCSENEESIDHGSIEVSASGGSDKDGKTDEDGDGENDSDSSDSDAAPYFPCHVCGKTFLTSENLEDHQRCHLGEKPHECAECGKCFFQASQLLQHQRTHTSEFQCQTCHRGFVSLFALRKHKHTHGKSRPYRCSKCDLSFTGHSQLAEHMAMHREDNFPCDICNRTFSCKSSRAEHRKSHSVESGDLPPLIFEDEVDDLPLAPFTSQKYYRCGVCHQCFEDPKELSEHGCLAAKERPFSCSVCDLYFLHESHLEKHKISNHQRQSYEYLCNQCHICFSSEKSYLCHARKHHREKRHALNIKEEDAVENSTVPKTVTEYQVCNTKNTDLVGVQNPPPINDLTHECKICKCTFPTERKLKEHERCHFTADTQFECIGCGQNFLGTDAFRQHQCSRSLLKSDHSSKKTKKSPVSGPTLGEEEEVDVTGEDVFNCFACSEQFSTKSFLLEHQNECHPKVQLKCGICGKTFKHRQELIHHERTHLADREARATVKKKKQTRLSCFKCPTMFDTVQEMALHMKSHCVQDYLHYRCDMCYRSFSQLSLLKQHHESHVGQVVYECTECDKAFAFLHLLEEHQLTHAGPSK